MLTRSEAGRRVASVVVAGGGFSGTLVALNLLRLARSGVQIDVFERSGWFGRGAAFRTTSSKHLLNVPAESMSAWPDEPGHFVDWLASQAAAPQTSEFASRRLYGDYLAEMLQIAASTAPGRLRLHEDEIVDAQETADGVRILTGRGERRRVDSLILATGNPQQLDPIAVPDELRTQGVYLDDPWSVDPLEGLADDAAVLLIGTGLSAVDIVVDAHAREFRGVITGVSRHGLTPLSHVPGLGEVAPPFVEGDQPETALAILRQLRAMVAADPHGVENWRAVVDSLRPRTAELWKGLSESRRGRFLEHLSPYWDVHRHRVAPEIADALEQSRSVGRFEVIAGRLTALASEGEEAVVEIQERTSKENRRLVVQRVINCTEPTQNVQRTQSALIRALLDRGLAVSGSNGLGMAATEEFRLIRDDGTASARLHVMGPLLRGTLWETTDVCELRMQALDLARGLSDRIEELSLSRIPAPHWKFSSQASQSLRSRGGGRRR